MHGTKGITVRSRTCSRNIRISKETMKFFNCYVFVNIENKKQNICVVCFPSYATSKDNTHLALQKSKIWRCMHTCMHISTHLIWTCIPCCSVSAFRLCFLLPAPTVNENMVNAMHKSTHVDKFKKPPQQQNLLVMQLETTCRRSLETTCRRSLETTRNHCSNKTSSVERQHPLVVHNDHSRRNLILNWQERLIRRNLLLLRGLIR